MKITELLKRKYQNIAEKRLWASAFFGGYFFIQKIRNTECRKSYDKLASSNKKQLGAKGNLKELCIAAICDDMTWQNIKQECNAYSITPRNWKKIFNERCPDVFFCESAWLGIKEQGNCWHGKIYKNHRLLFENRKELLEILRFCKEEKIPTVFWNKEDPAFWGSEKYDFIATGMEFDYIFTTAIDCVEKYKKLGHTNVDVLPFGFSPYLFNPMNCYPKENTAVFAGSWYGEEKERCQNLIDIFEMVLEKRIPVVIYDRQTGTTKEGRTFPEKYQKYVKAAVSFEDLGKVLKRSRYAINVNTINDSETMFARRVLEFMAMNTVVISNDSVGMKKLFQDRVWFLKENFNIRELEKKCLKNLEYVFVNRTNQKLLTDVFEKIGVLEKQKPKKVIVLSITQEISSLPDCDYCFFWDGKSKVPDFEKILPHFCYLPTDCGIRVSQGNEFVIQEDSNNQNTLFSKEMSCLILEQPEARVPKYLLGISAK